MLRAARSASVAAFLFALVSAGGPGAQAEGGCPCDGEAGLEVGSSLGDVDHDHADDGPGAHETCPPDCDDCACCGSAPVASLDLRIAVAPVAPVRAAAPASTYVDAPRGRVTGVFRPPRA